MSEELYNTLKSRQTAKLLEEMLSQISGLNVLGFVEEGERVMGVEDKYNEMIKISAIPLTRISPKSTKTEIDRWLSETISQTNIQSRVYLKISELPCSKWIEIQSEKLNLSLSSILHHLNSKDITVVDRISKSVLAIFEEEDMLEIHFRQ